MERNFSGIDRGYGVDNEYDIRLREELRLREEMRQRDEFRLRMLGGLTPASYGTRFAPFAQQPPAMPGWNSLGSFNGQMGNGLQAGYPTSQGYATQGGYPVPFGQSQGYPAAIGYGAPNNQFGSGGYGPSFGQSGGDFAQQQNPEFYAAQGGSSIPFQAIEPWSLNGPFVGVGPRNYKRSDETIRDEINSRLTQHGQLDASDIDVKVATGEVTLSGTVHSRYEKRLAEDVVELVAGIKDVHNQLHIRKPIPQQAQQQQQGNRVGEPLLSR